MTFNNMLGKLGGVSPERNTPRVKSPVFYRASWLSGHSTYRLATKLHAFFDGLNAPACSMYSLPRLIFAAGHKSCSQLSSLHI